MAAQNAGTLGTEFNYASSSKDSLFPSRIDDEFLTISLKLLFHKTQFGQFWGRRAMNVVSFLIYRSGSRLSLSVLPTLLPVLETLSLEPKGWPRVTTSF